MTNRLVEIEVTTINGTVSQTVDANITQLVWGGEKLLGIAECVRQLRRLEQFFKLNFRSLKKVSDWLPVSPQLTENHIKEFPISISGLRSLRGLFLNKNILSSLPREIDQLQGLTTLSLADNQFDVFPIEITALVSLQELFLNGNRLRVIPPEISRIRTLQTFWIENNQLLALPHEIVKLDELQQLYVHQNRLTWIPIELSLLPKLAFLHLDSNPLPIQLRRGENCVALLDNIFSVTSQLEMIRWRTFEICVALESLRLPALVTLEIIDAACINDVCMKSKWDLIVAVKHFCRTTN